MQRIHWPDGGHRPTYRRLVVGALGLVFALSVGLGYLLITTGVTTQLVGAIACMAAVCILGPAAERTARTTARRAEIRRSYAGLVVTHHGLSLRIDERPRLGSYPTRRLAAAAALRRGRWSVLVPAYGRWWALDAMLHDASSGSPLALRGCAVADVVPAIA